MLRRFTRKRWIAALSTVTALVVASAAIAYFTSTGSGTGNAAVGESAHYTVTVDVGTGPALLPGSGVDNLAYHVNNASSANQSVSSITAALTTDTGGGVYDTTSQKFVDGCQASWFTVTNHPGTLPANLASGATHDGSADVSLTDSHTNQDPCQGVTPQLTVTAS